MLAVSAMSTIRASRKPSRSNTFFAAWTRRALVWIPLGERRGLGVSSAAACLARALLATPPPSGRLATTVLPTASATSDPVTPRTVRYYRSRIRQHGAGMTVTVHDPLEFDVLGTGLGFPEGPVIADDGTVFAVDIDGGRVLHIGGGAVSVVAVPGGGPNGMALETASTAIVANNGGFLWSEVEPGVRIPIDRATHTNEPPGFS